MSDLVSLLQTQTGLSAPDIRLIATTAPKRYKIYPIAKRDGGVRWIAHPARELKLLQRALVNAVLSDLPIHDAATAYRKHKSIRDNALAHVNNGPILKYDFKDFFPSIRDRDWKNYCDFRGLFDTSEDVDLSSQILFLRQKGRAGLRLAIGAPSSPILSNILMHDFDCRVSDAMKPDLVTYTRYADDLTFSAKRTGYLTVVERRLKEIISDTKFPSLKLNIDKTVYATKKYRRFVTGLVLANDGSVSLGHERKKKIRAAVHHASQNRLDVAELARLAGMLAFARSIEPDFIQRLAEKYGTDLIVRIKKSAR